MDIRVGPDAPGRAATWLADRLRDAHGRRGQASLALSGGSTAPRLIAALLDEDVPWESTIAWQVDERVAPDGDERRNSGQLVALPCPVRPMPVTAPDLIVAARQYGAGLPERFDVVHLGIGEDGHTASWPPGDPGPIESDRAVELVGEFHGVARMTLTPRIVNDARCRLVLATGAAKRDAVERWMRGDDALPVRALDEHSTWVFLDDAAAPTGAAAGSGPPAD